MNAKLFANNTVLGKVLVVPKPSRQGLLLVWVHTSNLECELPKGGAFPLCLEWASQDSASDGGFGLWAF